MQTPKKKLACQSALPNAVPWTGSHFHLFPLRLCSAIPKSRSFLRRFGRGMRGRGMGKRQLLEFIPLPFLPLTVLPSLKTKEKSEKWGQKNPCLHISDPIFLTFPLF
jgi:hypothetical protein